MLIISTKKHCYQWAPVTIKIEINNKTFSRKFPERLYNKLRALLLVPIYDLLENRRTDYVTIDNFFFRFITYNKSRFHVAVLLFSNRSPKTSKTGKNISDTLHFASCAPFLFLLHFDIICDLLLNRCTATCNLVFNLTNSSIRYSFPVRYNNGV